MKNSNEFNDIGPKNQLQTKPLEKIITKQDFKKNDLSTTSVEKVNNETRSSRQEKVEKKSNAVASIFKAFAIVASTVIIGTQTLGLAPPSGVTASFDYVEAYETGVYCEVSVSEYQDGIMLILHNDFTNREQPLESPEEDYNWYYFEDLKPNMYYTLSIVKGKAVLATTRVYTRDRVEEIDDGYEEDDKDNPTNNDYPSNNG